MPTLANFCSRYIFRSSRENVTENAVCNSLRLFIRFTLSINAVSYSDMDGSSGNSIVVKEIFNELAWASSKFLRSAVHGNAIMKTIHAGE